MTLAALLLLLSYPAAWEQRTVAPTVICQVVGTICLMQSGTDVLVMDGPVLSPLRGADARLVWNEASLRAHEWVGLQRDRRGRVGQ